MKFLFSLFLLILSYISFGQEKVNVTLTPNPIMIGDHMELTLRARNAGSIIFPKITDSTMGNFKLVETLKPDTLYSGNEATISKKYIITCFEDSLQVFPSLGFNDGLSQTMYSKPIQITVNSPNIDSAKDIRPIKNIILVPLTKAEIISYLFVSLILLGLVMITYFVYIKFIRKEALFDKDKPEDPPHVVALKALKEVENSQLWQRGNAKEYYDRISDTVRLYIEKRFGIKALEQTTFQILNALKSIELPDKIVSNMAELLQLADLAKFAKENPEKDANEAILKYAYSFIQNTQMSYDANKKANALKVRKFYGQNKYGYKTAAINQSSFRILAYGLIATFAILALAISLSYGIPIDYLLGLIANSPLGFFFWFIFFGIVMTLIVMYSIRGKMNSFLVIFDYNSVIIRRNNNQYTIGFGQLESIVTTKTGDIELKEITEKRHLVSRKIEYFEEVKERLKDILDIEQKNTTVE